LLGVVVDSVSSKPGAAMNHAIRALADVTKTGEGKHFFYHCGGLEPFAKLLDQNVEKIFLL
jgi:hypothetical protein